MSNVVTSEAFRQVSFTTNFKTKKDIYHYFKYNSSGIILSNNHPIGQLLASDEDRKMTERMVSIGHLIGIEVLDHVIV